MSLHINLIFQSNNMGDNTFGQPTAVNSLSFGFWPKASTHFSLRIYKSAS